MLVLGTATTYYANSYAESHASNYVTDIILDNVPVVNVNFIFSEGAAIFFAFLLLLGLAEPRRIPFMLKSIALFIITRSIFIMLTHIASPLHQSYINPKDWILRFSSGDDLFFSGHTGLPLLMAFLFWDTKWLRYAFIAATITGGVAVLLGHLHYSIDVFSALFITYGIFVIAKKIMPKDYRLFISGDNK